jgi:serine/threonine protein kinase
MTQPNWERIKEIFHDALELPRAERRAFVANACGNDPDCVGEVNSLLKADEQSNGFLQTPIVRIGSFTNDLVGTSVARRYLVERELGCGGMSRVYYAIDLTLNRNPVVIKVLSEELFRDAQARQRVDNEVTALLLIRHQGIVRVLDRGELADGRPFIVMEYVDGETLRLQIPTDGMDLERAASILNQIGEALGHVHEKGILHRDLKPENIIIKHDKDEVVLIDFGIAKLSDPAIAQTTVNSPPVGTLRYMSPEQLRGEKITATSDVYSMGVVAHELVTGRQPFDSTTAVRLLEQQRKGVAVKPSHLRPNLSRHAQHILLRALKFQPKARYQNAKEFGDRLADALSEIPKKGYGLSKVIAASLAILMVATLLWFGFDKYAREKVTPLPSHSFSYWVTVQKMRDGKEYQAPFKSNGNEETFEGGDKFRLAVSSPEPGYLYIINEGPSEPNDTNFRIIYPKLDTNNGAATLGADQSIESDWITFRGPAGNENFWIVWSVSPVSQLEAAKPEAFKHPKGGLTGMSLIAVREFLRMKQAEVKVRVTRYKATQTAVVRGSSEMLVAFAQFAHR